MPTQLGIFAKHWTPGRVKTRLAVTIGRERAAEVARCLLKTLLVRMSRTADRHVVGYTPSDAGEPFERLAGPEWCLSTQCEGDLGQRMEHYFRTAFAAGFDRVVLIGADSPTLPQSIVADAFERLTESSLVLAPTDDGGYCLIGASGDLPPIFDEMPWGEPTLWQATVARLEQHGWRRGDTWHELPPWYDVDAIDDLVRLRQELSDHPDDAALVQLRRDLDRILND